MTTARPSKYSPLGLDTIPAEIRAIIYSHIQNPIHLKVDYKGDLDTKFYPWQLSAVSHLIRNEFLPRLLGKVNAQPLHLLCENGKFPDNVRRRIPNRILYGISSIILLDHICYDELKPSLTNFPNLQELRFDFFGFHGLTFVEEVRPTCDFYTAWSVEEALELIRRVKSRIIMPSFRQMKQTQEMPREGLERDYYADGTLFEVLEMTRERRGFDVKFCLNMYISMDGLYGIVAIDSWDEGTGHVDVCSRTGEAGEVNSC